MLYIAVIQLLLLWMPFVKAAPVSYREQITRAQVIEDRNTALNSIQNNFTEYCEWQSLDKNLYKIDGNDRIGLHWATQAGEEFENPFRLEDHIDDYRVAKSQNSLADARNIFREHARLRSHLSLLDYSQLGSHHLQTYYDVTWQILVNSDESDDFNYFGSLLELLRPSASLTHDDTDLHSNEVINQNYRFARMSLEGRELEVLGLCSFISPLNGFGCRNAIFSNLDLFTPKYFSIDQDGREFRTASITATPIFKKILYGSEYTENLRESAIDFLELIVNGSYTENTNAYDILYSNFKNSGLSDYEAKTNALNVMATLSTGGGNFHSRILNRDLLWNFSNGRDCLESCNLNSIYLTSMVSSIVFLDHLKKQRFGNTFSFPKEIRYECNMGDWYHFWMAAGLVRYLNTNSYSKTLSKLATFTMTTGYHLHDGFLLTKQKFGTLINSASQDLLLASLGIRFGLDEVLDEVVNYEATLRDYLAQMSTQPPLTNEDLVSLSTEEIALRNAQLLGIRYLFNSIINN